MREAGWYVIQVQSGRERVMCDLIKRVCSEASALSDEDGYRLLEECFTPRFRTRQKDKGQWVDVERLLLPGYVVAVTSDPGALAQRLRKLPDFTRLLVMGETFVPLREEERAWMEEWTHKEDRTIGLSVAYKQGDTIVVTEGPLKGREGMVTRVNRRKCLAFVEIDVGGKKVTTTVGLAIVPEPDISNIGVEYHG